MTQILPPITLVQSLFPILFYLLLNLFFSGTAENVTHWGYSDAARDPPTNKSFGGNSEFVFFRKQFAHVVSKKLIYYFTSKSSQTPETELA